MCLDCILALDLPDLEPFEDRDDNKERRNKAKERRISISLVILTFIASVCVLFGTLFPELSRGEVDMVPWRNVILTTGKIQPHLIKDRITLVNLGLWRYCYDDQLYDLVELINPYYRSSVKKRSTDEEEGDNEVLSIEKRQTQVPEGDISIRCHPVPDPWKMPYHVKNKTEATKVCLLVGIVMCIVSFLLSILVLITRLRVLKLLQLITCLLAVIALGCALGISMTMQEDAEEYFNESIGRKVELTLKDEMNIDLGKMGIELEGMNLVEMAPGVCGYLLGGGFVMMAASVIIAEAGRHL